VTDESDDILSRVEDGVGFVTLNRPKAINSLNQGMVDELSMVLAGWEQDATVGVVVLSGAGERGLCAGGDVVGVSHECDYPEEARRRPALTGSALPAGLAAAEPYPAGEICGRAAGRGPVRHAAAGKRP